MPNIGEIKRDRDIGYKSSNGYHIWLACPICGKERWERIRNNLRQNKQCHACGIKNRVLTDAGRERIRLSLKSREPLSGKFHPNWKGGTIIDRQGYVQVTIAPDDFFAPMRLKKGYVKEHRLLMARHLGRCLQSWELVHHKNGIRDDNRIENLELGTNGSHSLAHSKGYRDGYQKGYVDSIGKLEELLREVKILRLQNRNMADDLKKFCHGEVKKE